MININSHKELIEKVSILENSFLFIYKKGNESSDCSHKSIEEAEAKIKNVNIFSVDVNSVKDIHGKYDVKTVPTLLKFKKNKFVSVYKGCNDTSFYLSIFNNNFYASETEATLQKNVIVYSTPTCSWCNRLKTYLKENGIKFRDIDVSRDQKAAENMVKRSGQQGVPQSLINGQLIIGFDKTKIDNLLGIG